MIEGVADIRCEVAWGAGQSSGLGGARPQLLTWQSMGRCLQARVTAARCGLAKARPLGAQGARLGPGDAARRASAAAKWLIMMLRVSRIRKFNQRQGLGPMGERLMAARGAQSGGWRTRAGCCKQAVLCQSITQHSQEAVCTVSWQAGAA